MPQIHPYTIDSVRVYLAYIFLLHNMNATRDNDLSVRPSETVQLIMITCDAKESTLNITSVKYLNFIYCIMNSCNLKNVCNLARAG